MNQLQTFSESLGFIVFFLIGCTLIGVFAGENVQYWFLILILASMLIINSGKFSAWFGSLSRGLTGQTPTTPTTTTKGVSV